MQTKKNYKWEVVPSNTPAYIRKCSKCNCMSPYYCSEKFRVNAQKKTIDVWLIYKCSKCDNTLNIEVFSRVNPQSVDEVLYENFLENDAETAWSCAFDKEIIRKNKVNADYSNISFNINGDEISLEDMQKLDEDIVEIDISQNYDMDIQLTDLIKKHFGISSSQLVGLLSSGSLTVFPLGPVKKRKLVGENKIIFNLQKMRKFFCKDCIDVEDEDAKVE